MGVDYQATILRLEEEKLGLKVKLSKMETRLANLSVGEEPAALNEAYEELLQKLKNSEEVEHELKNKIFILEAREKELHERMSEHKRSYDELVTQLQDQEDSTQKMRSLEYDYSDLLDQMEHLREVERRFKDIQQSEEFLQGRVEELEQTESVS